MAQVAGCSVLGKKGGKGKKEGREGDERG